MICFKNQVQKKGVGSKNMSRTTDENLYDINLSSIHVKSTKWFSLNLERHTTDAT